MKHTYLYILISLAAVLAVSCDKDPQQTPDSGPRITFAPGVVCTKAILDSDDVDGDTELTVYDYTDITDLYIDADVLSFADGYTYNLAGEGEDGYSWMKEGKACDHSFFSWMTTDKFGTTASSLFGANGLSYSYTDTALTVPNTTMTLASTQFDFCYSSIIERKGARADYSPVAFQLHHLFTSFGFKAYNYTTDKITITTAKLYGLVNNKGAKIAYHTRQGENTVTYGTTDLTKLNAVELIGSPVSMNADSGVDNFITSSSFGSHTTSDKEAFFLMWPQTADELNITTTPTVDASGAVTAGSGQAFIVIGYKVNDGATVTYKAIPLRPESWVDGDGKNTIGWDAGTCHQLEIGFTESQISLSVQVMPWDLYEPEIDYSGAVQIKAEGQLRFVGAGSTCTVDETNKRVYFKGGNPIKATFKIDAPLAASWMISKKGDWDSFEIDTEINGVSPYGDKIDTATGTIDGDYVTFTIYPKVTDPDSDREINLSFSIRGADGNTESIDDLMGEYVSYTIVLQAS